MCVLGGGGGCINCVCGCMHEVECMDTNVFLYPILFTVYIDEFLQNLMWVVKGCLLTVSVMQMILL